MDIQRFDCKEDDGSGVVLEVDYDLFEPEQGWVVCLSFENLPARNDKSGAPLGAGLLWLTPEKAEELMVAIQSAVDSARRGPVSVPGC